MAQYKQPELETKKTKLTLRIGLTKCIALFISLFIGQKILGQSVEASFELANTLKKAHNYKGALDLYKRVHFFDTSAIFGYRGYLSMAHCAQELGELQDARGYYDLAINSTTEITKQDSILMQKARIELLHKKFHLALQDLFSVSERYRDQDLKQFYLAVSYYGLEEIENFKFEFAKLPLSASDSLKIHDICHALERKLSDRRVKRMKLLSYILPGLGQVVSGDIKSGANSFVLVSGLIWLYVLTVERYGLAHGLLAVTPAIVRYYGGGIENAEEAALARQAKVKDKYFKEVLGIAGPYLR